MKKTKIKRTKNNHIVKEILKKQFIPDFENWLRITIYKGDELSLGGIVLIEMLKDFQKTKDPGVLGRAIRFAPIILDHGLVRTQVINWISEGSKSRPKKEDLRNPSRFAEELIPKPSRKTITDKFHESIDGNLLKGYKRPHKIYDAIREAIEKKFAETRNRLGGQKLHHEDRVHALKDLFANHSRSYDHLKIRIKVKGMKGHVIAEKTFNQCCELWARSSRASEIALGILSSTIDARWGCLIGTKTLKRIIKKSRG